MADDLVFERTTANRLLVADLLDGLSDEQWRQDTLCVGWDVHTLAAHLLQPAVFGFGRFVLAALREGGDTDRAVDRVARRLAHHDRRSIVRLLREHAADRVSPARVGPMGPFAETCLHLRDIARPLRLDADVPVTHWTALLDYLCAPGVAPALVPAGRLGGLRLEATDTAWSAGSGEVAAGPAEAIAMAVTGRTVALADLAGAGVEVLADRTSCLSIRLGHPARAWTGRCVPTIRSTASGQGTWLCKR